MVVLPTLRQLQFFMALVHRKSFSKAAEDCFVSQSTLSSAIKELESILQCQLVDRSTRHFGLTPAGQDVADRAAGILANTEDLARSVAVRRPLEGVFNLGVIPTIAPFLLPKATRKLKRAFPKLELFLREDLTDALVERLSTGALDAALLAFPYDIPGTDMIEIGEDPFWFAARPDHRLVEQENVPLAELKNESLLLLEDGHCLRDHAIDACKLRRPETAAAFGATSLLTLAQMVQSGLGSTLLPQMAVKAGMAKSTGLASVPLASPAPTRNIGIAWRRGSGRREEAEALAEIFREQFSD